MAKGKKLNRKQIKQIAEMWSAGLLIQCGIDSFSDDDGIIHSDVDAIILEVNKIAIKLAKGRRQYYTLEEIIKQAIGYKPTTHDTR